jgi:hypothetical protein
VVRDHSQRLAQRNGDLARADVLRLCDGEDVQTDRVSESAQPLPWDATTIGHHGTNIDIAAAFCLRTFVQEIAKTVGSAW